MYSYTNASTSCDESSQDVAVTELAVYWNVNTENLMSELPNAEIEV